ncbi:MAG: hemerythrin domain-containing protein [Aureibaculum sp.]
MPKPTKRSKALMPISREHHHGLLLSFKIREGLKKKIAPSRIKKYTDWFWESHLQSHFDFEEKYIFPILGKNNDLIKRALQEHTRLKQLFFSADKVKENLLLIEQELTAHIRFEERILFTEIESVASEDELHMIASEHSKVITDEWQDEFWKVK